MKKFTHTCKNGERKKNKMIKKLNLRKKILDSMRKKQDLEDR